MDADENEERSINIVMEMRKIIEKYARRSDISKVWRQDLPPSKSSSEYTLLLDDPLFEDILTDRYIEMEDTVGELNLVKNYNLLILKLINRELKEIEKG